MRLGAIGALGAFLLSGTPSLARDAEVRQYAALAKAGGGVVKLDDRLYEDIIAGPRNYSVSIVLTALNPQFKCMPCR